MRFLTFSLILALTGCAAETDDEGSSGNNGSGGNNGFVGFNNGSSNNGSSNNGSSNNGSSNNGSSNNGSSNNGSSEDAFGRYYSVTNISVSLGERDANGECWDVGCGAPDAYAIVTYNGDIVAQTEAQEDRFDFFFNTSERFLIYEGAEVGVYIIESDVASDDPAIGCEIASVEAGHLDGGEIGCDDGNSYLSFRIEAR
jgi:hypothetical protein